MVFWLFLSLNLLIAKDYSLPIKIRQDMKYEKARNILLNSGWQTVTMHSLPNGTPKCWYSEPDDYSCHFKEIDSCSGTGMGFCKMWFYDGDGGYLVVRTMGGPPPRAYVDGWYRTKDRPKIDYGF